MRTHRAWSVGSALIWTTLAWACSSASGGLSATGASDGGEEVHEDRDGGKSDAGRDARTDAKKPDGGREDTAASDAGDDDADVPPDGATPCSSSTCVVEEVTEVSGAKPTNLVVDGTDVYFSYHLGRYIHKAPKTGGTTTLVAAAPNGWLLHLAADATHLFVVNSIAGGYLVDEVSKSGGAFRNLYTSGAASSIDVDNFVLDGNVIYLAAGKNGGGVTDLLSINKATTVATPVNAAWSPGHWLAASGSNLFWASSGQIYRAQKTGAGSPQSIAWPGSELNVEIVADGADVFYGFKRDIELHKITGTSDVTLNTNQPPADFVWGPVVDATHVYVIATDASDMGTVYRVARTGGTLEVFADQQDGARGLALDGTHVYWASWRPNASGETAPYVVRKPK